MTPLRHKSQPSEDAAEENRALLSTAPVDRRGAIAGVAGALLAACARGPGNSPSIAFTRIPQADAGGGDKHDIIEGRVSGARPGQQIVLYARSGNWWLQPVTNHPFTRIQPNAGWTNATHLGSEYAALLVDPSYRPLPAVNALPAIGGAVSAVAVVKGANAPPSRFLRFSGYEWRVRDKPSARGGGNAYDTANAWTDESGALHLRIAKQSGKWTCAEVTLTRSLGYGTYSFVVRDISQLEPAAVFSIFTYDYAAADQNYGEMGTEISRWGDPASKNAQYILQPYYVPNNVARFTAPAGPLTYTFHWEPGRIAFTTLRGSRGGAVPIAAHAFSSGVPVHGIESIRMNVYVFVSGHVPLERGTEVVVEKFEYLP